MIGNSDSAKSFAKYIADCRKMLQERRIVADSADLQLILDINSPFELIPSEPTPGKKYKYGVLLIHGLFDCPFSMREVAEHLQAAGMLCRAVLLPGHGTNPDDLLNVQYQEWINTVRYGLSTFENEVENLFIVGYSTGATLAIYHALHNPQVKGIITIAPLLRIKSTLAKLLRVPQLTNWFQQHRKWLAQYDANDYAKYTSISFNAVHQVDQLTQLVAEEQMHKKLECPQFMAISNDDQVVSSKEAMNFFLKYHHHRSAMLLYSHVKGGAVDARIECRNSIYPELGIKNFSHVALPFSPHNPHYGQHGDFTDASKIEPGNIYGAYNNLEMQFYDWLYRKNMLKTKRRELTYNPDFDYMMQKIIRFIHIVA